MRFLRLAEIPLPEQRGTRGAAAVAGADFVKSAALDERFDFIALDGHAGEKILERRKIAGVAPSAEDIAERFRTQSMHLHQSDTQRFFAFRPQLNGVFHARMIY